jgi:UDPglucose 6-dehydrogenase
MQVTVVGCGYVGLVAAACYAELGHQVINVDNDPRKIATLQAGDVPIHEEYLSELLRKHKGERLTFSPDLPSAVRGSEIVVIAVGTPAHASGEADLSFVDTVTKEIASAMNGYKVIVEKSTVPVHTNAWITRAMILNGCAPADFDVVSNPEFLREGTAVTDFLYPDRIIVGVSNQRSAAIMRNLYQPLLDGCYQQSSSAIPRPDSSEGSPVYLETSPQTAELIKHASNAFLAMKISFINAVSNIAESVDADVEDIQQGMGTDKRIGARCLKAGVGYGGSCFPKDVAAFQAIADACGSGFKLLEEVRKINDEQQVRFVAKVRNALWTLKNKKLAVLGLAYKNGTDDLRESPAMNIIRMLLQEGAQIVAFDPAAMERAKSELGDLIQYASDPYATMQGANALLILTEWEEFGSLDIKKVRSLLQYPIVLDGRNLYARSAMVEAGLNYYSVGRAPVEISHHSPSYVKVNGSS